MLFIIIFLFFLDAIVSLQEDNETKICKPGNHLDIEVLKRGDIFSPGFKEGKNYPVNIKCAYYLHTKPGWKIRLKFIEFDLESADICRGDSVRIFEGDSEQNSSHGIFCGNSNPEDILSIEHELYIVFNSDFMITKRGFHITYESTTDDNLCPNQIVCKNRKCVPTSVQCDGIDDCQDGTDEENCGHSVIETPNCGQTAKNPLEYNYERIIGGTEVIPGSWPWQADLQLKIFHPCGHVCGGSLINSHWIITASHCLEPTTDKNGWRIHLGNHHKFSKDESEQVRYPEHIIAYPNFTGDKLKNWTLNMNEDITLMKLNVPVKFEDNVQPVCLPEQDLVIPVGTECYATGWGETRGTGKNDVLKQTKLIIHNEEACYSRFMDYNNKTMICAGIVKGHHGPCHGDSGGPLVCKLKDKWTLIGVASYIIDTNYIGALCGVNNVPTSFARVSVYRNWIKEIMKKYD